MISGQEVFVRDTCFSAISSSSAAILFFGSGNNLRIRHGSCSLAVGSAVILPSQERLLRSRDAGSASNCRPFIVSARSFGSFGMLERT